MPFLPDYPPFYQLGKEAQMMERDAPPFCFARPREDNVLEW